MNYPYGKQGFTNISEPQKTHYQNGTEPTPFEQFERDQQYGKFRQTHDEDWTDSDYYGRDEE